MAERAKQVLDIEFKQLQIIVVPIFFFFLWQQSEI